MKKAPIRIFISRELHSKSEFHSLLEKLGKGKIVFEVVAKSCLVFSPIAFSLPDSFDAVCFYSQKGFDYFLRGLPAEFEILPPEKLIAYGAATANYMEKKGWHPSIVGNGTPEFISKQILNQFTGKKILFPQAKFSKNSLQPFLENQLTYLSLVVYSNEAELVPNLGSFNCSVFTSPKNVQSFQKSNHFSGKIVAIGAATAAQLLELTELPILMSTAPYEAQLAEAVIKALEL